MTMDVVSAILLFLVAYIPSCWVIYYSREIKSRAFDAITAGIFIGTALFHMLSDAVTQLYSLTSNAFWATIFICALTMQGMYLWSRLLKVKSSLLRAASLSSLLIVMMLGVHSLFEGMTLGFISAFHVFFIASMAIAFHKGAASFALTSHLLRHPYRRVYVHSIMLIFSLLSPLGMIIGIHFLTVFSPHMDSWLAGIFLSVAAGTFVYIGLSEYIIPSLQTATNRMLYLGFCALGIVLMGFLAWIV